MADHAGNQRATGGGQDDPPLIDHVEFAIICALPRELDAVEASLDEVYDDEKFEKKDLGSNFYKIGRMGPFNIVLACLPEMGKESAASAASSLRNSFPNVSLTLVVGIYGGVPFPSPDTELILGDVVISHEILRFDSGRQFPDRFEPRFGVQDTLDRSDRSTQALLSALKISSTQREFGEMHTRYLQSIGQKARIWQYPGVDKDQLFPSSTESDLDSYYSTPDPVEKADISDITDTLERPPKRRRLTPAQSAQPIQRKRLAGETPKPRLHFGPIGSADTVMKSARHRDELARTSHVVGFEMEGSGVCHHLSCVIIKGACDYADSHKNKTWQDYAAASAACAAKSFVEFLATKKFGSFIYCKTLQASKTDFPAGSDPECQWRLPTISSQTSDLDDHIQDVEKALDRSTDTIPGSLIRRSLVKAAQTAIAKSRTEIQRMSTNRMLRSTSHHTWMGRILFQTQMIKHRVCIGDESSVDSEIQSSFVFHPAPWLLSLGMRYGLKATTVNHHSSWKFSITPVNARPDDSLIFRFCELGNIDAVRELFSRGEASVYDVKSNGMTPLHIAAICGHVDLAKLLIVQNADKQACLHESMWEFVPPATPSALITQCKDRQAWLEMFYLFADCIEFSDKDDLGWTLLIYPEFEFEESNLEWTYKSGPFLNREFLLALLERFKETKMGVECQWEWLVIVLWDAVVSKNVDLIHLLLEFDNTGLIPSIWQRGGSGTHKKFSNCESLSSDYSEDILPFAGLLPVAQVLGHKGIDVRTPFRGETPTSRSLRLSALFFFWKEDLKCLYPDINHIIEIETSENCAPSLRDWCSDLLGDLFSLSGLGILDGDRKEPYAKIDGPYFALLGAFPTGILQCSQCNFTSGPCSPRGDFGFLIEPWWEGLKHSVKHRECLCSVRDLVEDGRDQSKVSHGACNLGNANIDSRSIERTHGGIHVHPGADSDSSGFTGELSRISEPHITMSDLSDMAKMIPQWGEVNPFLTWAQHCYDKYGRWQKTWSVQEYSCFRCLSSLEGWHEEYEELCLWVS